MRPIVAVELVLAVALALLVAFMVYVWLRRRWIAGGKPMMLCAISADEDSRWRLGLLRISGERLDWFSVVGPSPRPAQSWVRHELDLGAPQRLGDSVPGLPPDAVSVRGHSTSQDYDLAMSPAAYTAVRAWLESSPPGYNVNVA